MNVENLEINIVEKWPVAEIVELYKAGGWWKEHYDPSGIGALIKGSFLFAVAMDTGSGKAIGMGRVISDGVSDGYIQDVVILNEYRGEGIGTLITKKLLDACLERGLSWIGLIAEKNSNAFYRPLGFKEFSGEPMVYERGE